MGPHPDNEAIVLLSNGSVARYSPIGCYPLLYLCADGGALCGRCVESEIEQCCDPHSGGWHVVAHGANWEDEDLHCDHCGERIESAYGGE